MPEKFNYLYIVQFETRKSVEAEVYFKMFVDKNGQRCEIFGNTKGSYCSIFCYLINCFFLNHFKPEIRVHNMCICT
jgi:hypothetical protein